MAEPLIKGVRAKSSEDYLLKYSRRYSSANEVLAFNNFSGSAVPEFLENFGLFGQHWSGYWDVGNLLTASHISSERIVSDLLVDGVDISVKFFNAHIPFPIYISLRPNSDLVIDLCESYVSDQQEFTEVRIVCSKARMLVAINGKLVAAIEVKDIDWDWLDEPEEFYWAFLLIEYGFGDPVALDLTPVRVEGEYEYYLKDDLNHISEIAISTGPAGGSNYFFTQYALAYERAGGDSESWPVFDPVIDPSGDGVTQQTAIQIKFPQKQYAVQPKDAYIVWFNVRINNAGHYLISTAGPFDVPDDTRQDTHLALFSEAGRLLGENDDISGDDWRSEIALRLNPGLYLLAISGYGAYVNSGFVFEPRNPLPESFNLAVVSYEPPPPPPPPPLTAITLPYIERLPLEDGALVHYYQFTVGGGTYLFDTTASLDPVINSTSIALYRESGELLLYGTNAAANDYRDKLVADLEAGDYRLALAQDGASFGSGFNVDASERLAGGVVLEIKQLLEGAGSSKEDAFWAKVLPYRQEVQATPWPVLWYEVVYEVMNEVFRADTRASSSAEAGTFLALFDESGALVAQSAADGESLARLDVRSLWQGKYYLALGGAGCEAMGDFQVVAGAAIPAGVVLDVAGRALDRPAALPVVNNQQESYPDGGPSVAWFTFINNSSMMSLEISSSAYSAPGTFVRVAVYDNFGKLLAQSEMRFGNTRESLGATVARGTFYIAVAGEGAVFNADFNAIAAKPLMAGTGVHFLIW